MSASKILFAVLIALFSYYLYPAISERLGDVVGSTSAANVVDLGYARYQGALDPKTRITLFLGMRYAAPPLGALRWHAPQPPTNVPGIQPALTQPKQCFQAPEGGVPHTPSPDATEDCLYLNVYTPSQKKGALPVLVWIHGGGYLQGRAAPWDGRDLIRQAGGNVVVVVIQYRLGIFGFLPGTKVKDNGSLNAGLLDQDFALRWVNTHIKRFGGDKKKVTIWGLSAGGGSVLQQVIANNGATKPSLFRAAITSSLYVPPQYHYNDPIPEELYSKVVKQSKCSNAADTLRCLRETDVDILQAANVAINHAAFYGVFTFVPVVDGTFIVRRPSESLGQRKLNCKHLLAVANTHEGDIYVDQTSGDKMTIQEYVMNLFPTLSAAQAKEAGLMYLHLDTTLDKMNAVMGEAIFVCPTYTAVRGFPKKAYKSTFAIPPGLHLDDIPYYFPSGRPPPPFNNVDFIKAFSQSFMAMTKSLDPNKKFDPANITPKWATWNDASRDEILFNKTEAGAPVVAQYETPGDLLKRCAFWDSVSAVTAQ